LKKAKTKAALTGTTLGDVVNTALRESLDRLDVVKSRERVVLPAHGGGRFQPGIDVDDSAGLLELLEGADARP
jgi:hypothetical protein